MSRQIEPFTDKRPQIHSGPYQEWGRKIDQAANGLRAENNLLHLELAEALATVERMAGSISELRERCTFAERREAELTEQLSASKRENSVLLTRFQMTVGVMNDQSRILNAELQSTNVPPPVDMTKLHNDIVQRV